MFELTEPQLRALKEIDAGHIFFNEIVGRYWQSHGEKADVTCLDGGLIELGPGPLAFFGSRRVDLTDRGREVLANG